MWFWIMGAVILTALIAFSLRIGYITGLKRGYKIGVEQVLNEWKKTLNEEEE